MEEIEFKGQKKREQASTYVPYTPSFVKAALAITGGWNPPLLIGASGPKDVVYRINGISARVYLKFTSEDGATIKETPLAMCPYVAPQGDAIYDYDVCKEATITNSIREQHNRFIVTAINEFMSLNDCGSSCGQICMPAAPVDSVKRRLEEITKLTKDKLGTTRKAIAYLAERELYCGRDFEFDDAFERANDICYTETCQKRSDAAITKITSGEGKGIRVNLEGRPPSWWDGSSPKDSAGVHVEWQRGKGHTFLTPELAIKEVFTFTFTDMVAVDSPSSPSDRLQPVYSDSSDEDEEPKKCDGFDSLFASDPSKTLRLTGPPMGQPPLTEEEVPKVSIEEKPTTVQVPIGSGRVAPRILEDGDEIAVCRTMNGELPVNFFD